MNTAKELSVSEAALQRRSVKSFKTDSIPEQTLDRIIEIARQAPSSFNLQPTRMVLIRSQEQKERLAQAAWNQKQILQAPVTVVFAVAIRGWEVSLDKVVTMAVEKGAWGDKMASLVRGAAPGFQNGLGEKEREYAMKDAMIMATILALTAESFGYGSCYMNGWVEDQVKDIIGVGADRDIGIALILPIGIPEEIPQNPGRLSREEIVFTDRLQ